jgi:hypothetical protein
VNLLAWLVELARTSPALVRSYLPGSPIDARTRERLILAVSEANGCRYAAWVHRGWIDYLGDGLDEPEEAEEALLAYARACAEAGRPVDASAVLGVLPPDALPVVRATVAQVEVSSLAGSSLDGLLARLAGRGSFAPVAVAGDAATVALAVPLAVPLLATGVAMRAATRLAPPAPEVTVPPAGEANLLVDVLARSVSAYLANAGVRLLLLRLPVPLSIGVRTGRSSATVRIGRGRVAIENGIATGTAIVLEGDIEPFLQLATGSLIRELARVRR